MTIFLRFMFGVVLACSIAVWIGTSFLLILIFMVTAGIVAAIWGDKFLLGFMRVMRYLR